MRNSRSIRHYLTPTLTPAMKISFESDNQALSLLERGGFVCYRGCGVILKHRNGTPNEEEAIRYLCAEWDYCWEHCHPHDGEEPSNEPAEQPYDEDSMRHLGDREDLATP